MSPPGRQDRALAVPPPRPETCTGSRARALISVEPGARPGIVIEDEIEFERLISQAHRATD
jgi:hypothetical protein